MEDYIILDKSRQNWLIAKVLCAYVSANLIISTKDFVLR